MSLQTAAVWAEVVESIGKAMLEVDECEAEVVYCC